MSQGLHRRSFWAVWLLCVNGTKRLVKAQNRRSGYKFGGRIDSVSSRRFWRNRNLKHKIKIHETSRKYYSKPLSVRLFIICSSIASTRMAPGYSSSSSTSMLLSRVAFPFLCKRVNFCVGGEDRCVRPSPSSSSSLPGVLFLRLRLRLSSCPSLTALSPTASNPGSPASTGHGFEQVGHC